MRMRLLPPAVLASVLALVVGGCGGGDAAPASIPIETAPPAPSPQEQAPASPAPTSIDTPSVDDLLDETERFLEKAAAPPEPEPPPRRSAPPEEETEDGEAEEGEPAEPALEEDGIWSDPGDFRQPTPSVTLEEIPTRPANFGDFGRAVLPWLQSRITADAIAPLFESWGMPSVAGGARLNLVDTNGQGLSPGRVRFSAVVVFTDPETDGSFAVRSNLVVYEPVPGTADLFQIAYDHDAVQAREGLGRGAEGIIVRGVTDVTGDGLRDVLFEELVCGPEGECTIVTYALSYADGGYRRTTVAELTFGG